jgi:hypothetical protein
LAHDDLVQFVGNALLRNDADAFFIISDGSECNRVYLEIKLCSETNSTKHPQRIIAESNIWLTGRADHLMLEIAQAIERINELAVVFRV